MIEQQWLATGDSMIVHATGPAGLLLHWKYTCKNRRYRRCHGGAAASGRGAAGPGFGSACRLVWARSERLQRGQLQKRWRVAQQWSAVTGMPGLPLR